MERFSIKQAASRLGVIPRRVYQFIEQGRLVAQTGEFSGKLFITGDQLTKFKRLDRSPGNPNFKQKTSLHSDVELDAESTDTARTFEPDPESNWARAFDD